MALTECDGGSKICLLVYEVVLKTACVYLDWRQVIALAVNGIYGIVWMTCERVIGRWKRECGECCLVCSFVWRDLFGCVLELIVVCVWGVFLIWRCCAETPIFLGTRKFSRYFVIR